MLPGDPFSSVSIQFSVVSYVSYATQRIPDRRAPASLSIARSMLGAGRAVLVNDKGKEEGEGRGRGGNSNATRENDMLRRLNIAFLLL